MLEELSIDGYIHCIKKMLSFLSIVYTIWLKLGKIKNAVISFHCIYNMAAIGENMKTKITTLVIIHSLSCQFPHRTILKILLGISKKKQV
jgi:hypothetical protein